MGQNSKMRELVNFISEKLLSGIRYACHERLSDMIDIQFLLRTSFIFKENSSSKDAKLSVAELFSTEITEHGEILTDLKELSNSFPEIDFIGTLSFPGGCFDAFDL